MGAQDSKLQRENRILRGLVQTNPGWVCPYGVLPKGKTLGACPKGFPGCACAEDRLAALAEGEGARVLAALQEQRDEAIAVAAEYREHVAAHLRIAAVGSMPTDVRGELAETLASCPCRTCLTVREACKPQEQFAEDAVRMLAREGRKLLKGKG